MPENMYPRYLWVRMGRFASGSPSVREFMQLISLPVIRGHSVSKLKIDFTAGEPVIVRYLVSVCWFVSPVICLFT